jgi:hypothetical protein
MSCRGVARRIAEDLWCASVTKPRRVPITCPSTFPVKFRAFGERTHHIPCIIVSLRISNLCFAKKAHHCIFLDYVLACRTVFHNPLQGAWLSGRASALHQVMLSAEGPGFDHLPVHFLLLPSRFFLLFLPVQKAGRVRKPRSLNPERGPQPQRGACSDVPGRQHRKHHLRVVSQQRTHHFQHISPYPSLCSEHN